MELDRNVIVGVLLLMLGVCAATYATLQYRYSIKNQGNISTVGCVALDDYGNPITNIDWGTLEPNSWVDKVVYVQNNGTVNIVLGLATENWNPAAAEGFLTLTWNYTGQILNPDQKIPLLLTLQVSQSISGITDFSFDIIITATEV